MKPKNRFRSQRVLLALLAAGLVCTAACSETPSAPPSTPTNPPARSAAAAAAPAGSPYGCYLSIALDDARFRYGYTRRELRFPQSAMAADRPPLEYRLKLQREGEEPVLVANCTIPRTAEAVRIVERTFGAQGVRYTTPRANPSGNSTISATTYDGTPCDSKVGDTYDKNKTCFALDPVGGTAPPPEGWDPYTTGGYVPSGGGGTSGGGGGTPCYNCTYSGSAVFSCTLSVPRGGTVSCGIQGAQSADYPLTTLGWKFVDALGRMVSSTAPTSRWEGTAVVGGTVTVRFDDGTGPREITSSFTVTNRLWQWGSADWHFSQGTAPTTETAEPAYGVRLGWNCRSGTLSDCLYGQRVQPDPRSSPGQGYTYAQVPTGPNTGFWYVTGVAFKLDDNSGINPSVQPGAPTRLLPDPQAQECRTNMGLAAGTAVYVNFYTFNQQCKGIDMAAFVNAVWAHEGFGSGSGNGHEAQTQASAGQAQNDPFAAIEDAAFQSDSDLRDEVTRRVGPITDRITSDAIREPTGNWSGAVWFWNPSTGQYAYSPLNPF